VNIGLCTISNREESVERVIETAGRVGYDGVEIWGKEPHVGDGSPERCEDIAEHAADCGVAVDVYGSYLRIGTDEFDGEMSHELDVTERLGAGTIRVWAGETDYGDHTQAEWEQAVSDLRALTGAATDRGIDVTVEKHQNSLTDTREGARRLVEAVDDDACGLNWQPSFEDPPEAVLADARALAPLSNNVHVQAVDEPGGGSRCALADAYFDLPAVLSAFDSAGFDGWVDVEFVRSDVDYETAVAEDYEYLRSTV
jgi:sugar phosphate isomerase/epimerase